MPAYRNGKEQKIYRNGKEIDRVYRNSKILYESTVAVPVAAQTISTLNTIWEADSVNIGRTGDDINTWTSNTGLVLTVSEPSTHPYYDYNAFGQDINGINFNGASARSLYISQADLDPDTTALELPQPYTVFAVLKMSAATRNSKVYDGLDTAGRWVYGYNQGQAKMQAFAGTVQFFGGAEVGVRKVQTIEFNGANSKVYRDTNTTPVITGDVGAQPLRGLRVGNAQGNNENFEGVIAAIRVKAGIDASYRNAEMARLVSKYLA